MTRGIRLRNLVAGLLAIGVLAGGLLHVRIATDLHSFLPAGDQQTRAYDAFAQEYGGEPAVVLLESDQPGAAFSTDALPQLVHLEGSLAQVDGTFVVDGPGTLLNQIAGQTQDLLAELIGRRDYQVAVAQQTARAAHASKAAVRQAGERARAAFDARYGPLIIKAMPMGLPTLSNPKFAQHVIFGSTGQPRSEWHFLVPSQQAVAIIVRPVAGQSAAQSSAWVDRLRGVISQQTPTGLRATVSGVPVLVGSINAGATRDVPVLGVLGIALVALILFTATWLARRRRLLPLAITLASMVATVSVLGWLHRPLSVGVLAFATVILGVGCYYPTYLAAGARRRTVVVVALATSGSLATLMVSPITMVQDLGLALALGVLLAALMTVLAQRWLRVDDPAPVSRSLALPSVKVLRVVLAAVALLAGVGWWQFTSLPLQANVTDFADGLPELAQAQHVSDVVGSSGQVDAVLRSAQPLSPVNLRWASELERQIVSDHGDQLRPALSPGRLLGFLGREPTASQVAAALRLLPSYLLRSVASADGKSATLTFGVRIDDLDQLRASIDDLGRLTSNAPAGTEATTTGLPVVLLHGEDLISGHRMLANMLGIGVAVLIVAIGFRRRADAARALLAAVISTGVGYAVLWLLGGGLNPVSASLAALITAVGCEFTVVQSEAVRHGNGLQMRAVAVGAATSAAGYAALLAAHISAVRTLGGVLATATLLAFGTAWLVVRAFPPSLEAPEEETSNA